MTWVGCYHHKGLQKREAGEAESGKDTGRRRRAWSETTKSQGNRAASRNQNSPLEPPGGMPRLGLGSMRPILGAPAPLRDV